MRLDVSTFRADCTDKDAAMKVLEEASEAREAWQALDAMIEYRGIVENEKPHMVKYINLDAERYDLADELADCITACCNLADRYGIDMQAALDRVECRNRERGRYDG